MNSDRSLTLLSPTAPSAPCWSLTTSAPSSAENLVQAKKLAELIVKAYTPGESDQVLQNHDQMINQISRMSFSEINQRDSEGNSFLHVVILKHKETAGTYASKYFMTHIASLLQNNREVVNAANNQGKTALHLACEDGSMGASEVIKSLIQSGANPNI